MRYKTEYSYAEITTLPGCSQVAVSHGVYIPNEHRGKGHGTKASTLRQQYMKSMGYDYAICTVESTNLAERKILDNNHWKELDRFISSRTGHEVILFGKRL